MVPILVYTNNEVGTGYNNIIGSIKLF